MKAKVHRKSFVHHLTLLRQENESTTNLFLAPRIGSGISYRVEVKGAGFEQANGEYTQKFEDQLEFYLYLGQDAGHIVSLQLKKRKRWCIIWQETTDEDIPAISKEVVLYCVGDGSETFPPTRNWECFIQQVQPPPVLTIRRSNAFEE